MSKTIRNSSAALAIARKANQASVGDISVKIVADYVDEELSQAIPILEKFELSLSRGLEVMDPRLLSDFARNRAEADLATVRSVIHRLKPRSLEVLDHE